MKKIKQIKKIKGIVVIIVCIYSIVIYSCLDVIKDCNPIHKIDEVIREVLSYDDIYIHTTHKRYYADTVNYLVADDFIKLDKIYIRHDSVPIYSIIRDSIKLENIGLFNFYEWEFNNDSTSVEFKLDFIDDNITTKTTVFEYVFNTSKCEWELKRYNSYYFR